jgi:hypothetical protein
MSLFKKPQETKSGVKVLAYGVTGSGKTKFGLTFPKIGAIDSEAGMEFYKNSPNLLFIHQTTSADEVEEGLEEIEDELSDQIETFMLDSETKINENLQHSSLELVERRARKKGQDVQDANLSQREWGKIKLINKRIQATKIKLSSMGINVVSIAQEKDLKEKRGDDWVIIGHAPDTAKGFEYDYDIVLRMVTKTDKDGTRYFAEVVKDRTGTYKKGDVIENASYDNWKHVVEGKKALKSEVIDYKKDIKKDAESIESEAEKIEEVLENIQHFIDANKGSTDTKSKLVPLLTEMKKLGITKLTSVQDVEVANTLFALCE